MANAHRRYDQIGKLIVEDERPFEEQVASNIIMSCANDKAPGPDERSYTGQVGSGLCSGQDEEARLKWFRHVNRRCADAPLRRCESAGDMEKPTRRHQKLRHIMHRHCTIKTSA
ncbi:hypothetical protein H5410_035718 [Solanum commersonii]|uniref:Uncharacterized protein n=1 Tax=Solanum commersonii TaxID=4109 RepID=A0A9J5Y5Z9_SOLCO|nr:hypothetical protein H5410_035718 [Solanum commersonii]